MTRENRFHEISKFGLPNIKSGNHLKDQNLSINTAEITIRSNSFPTNSDKATVAKLPGSQENVNSAPYQFSQLVEIELLQKLLNAFYFATGIPYGLIDIDHNVLSGIGWQDICTKFHRVHPETRCQCQQSDQYISSHLQDGPFIGYKCLNGLMDYGAPIFIEGQHLATIFLGQFLHELPDIEQFRRQAHEYGFDETAYLEALQKVPIIPKEQIDSIMEFYTLLAQILAAKGLERKRQLAAAEKDIREREELLRLILEATTNGFWDWNVSTGDINFSPSWFSLLGYAPEEIVPHVKTWQMMVHADDIALTQRLLDEHLEGKTSKYEAEYRMLNKSGHWQWMLSRGQVVAWNKNQQPLRMVGTFFDLTEKKQMERELRRLSNLNLVGEMAAGIAHEIRNPMTTVRGYLQLLRQNQDYVKEIEYFDLMIEEMDRANMIITEFLSLANNKMLELKPSNLNSIIRMLLPLLQASAMMGGHNLNLDMQNIPELLLDSKEIRQLIINLVNNGLEAMTAGSTLTIRTFVEEGKVVLSVEDHGQGIKTELLDKLGTPFFTTKEQGPGLGLAICYRIAARHNAKIDLDTSPRGTTFYVRFTQPGY